MNYKDKDDLVNTMRRLKICVLIPTYNNAGTLRDVISSVMNYAKDIIVVNDGSTDDTLKILEELKDSVTIVSYETNRGKGHALKMGFKKAIDSGYNYAITMDSDGQHYAEDLPKFVEAIAGNYGALIVGERDLSNVDINGKSSFANKFSNFWFCVQTGKRLKDTQTGYRAYPLHHLHALSLLTSRYEAELELLVFASWNGVEIISIPINVYYPPQSERISHFKPALDFTRISILNTILCIGAIVYGLPARMWNAIRYRRLFKGDFKPFTHKRGERKDASITLERLVRSIYGMVYFGFLSTCVITPIVNLYFSIGKTTEAKRLRLHKMLRDISHSLVRKFPGCKTIIENPHAVDFTKPALIICNHQSHLDIPVLLSVHRKLIFLTNDWVWNSSFYGKIIHNAEFIPVSAGLDEVLPKLRDLKERGYSIMVFPEGTRSADCSIKRFHQGAFHLAKELEMDIIPMALHGAGHYLPKNDFMFRKGMITLRIMPRISQNEINHLALRQQASFFRKMLKETLEDLENRKETSEYFKSLILYKYAYRGWDTVHRCKKILKKYSEYSDIIDTSRGYNKVAIVNSGIGVFALLYALVNKDTEVFAYESNINDYHIAAETAGLPSNLHYIHAVWNSEYNLYEVKPDAVILLDSRSGCPAKDIIPIREYDGSESVYHQIMEAGL